MSDNDLRLRSERLPGGTFARAVFDSQLMRLSDKGGASHLIGESWSDVVAGELDTWTGNVIPVTRSDLRDGIVIDIHRLDTIPGVAARASKLGLKNPDFLAHVECNGRGTVIGVDAKFSIETAREEQVSSEATSRLLEKDELLTALLPSMHGTPTYASGLFVSPDYNLTRAMFRQRMGHRRMTVPRHDVVLVDVLGADMFSRLGEPQIMHRLIALDSLPIDAWSSLLAGQYYFRLSRAMYGLALDEQLPLLGHNEVRADDSHVLKQVERRASRADSAWELALLWDRDAEHIRRQRLALHQVVGSPVSGAELRDLADKTLVDLAPEARPSRNQVRKRLGKMFTDDVIGRTGVIMPPLADFPTELERVAVVSRDVAERYRSDIDAIVRGVVESLVADLQDSEANAP